jgi:hypothetical protein
MPYKDPERKKEWERLHRTERLARRVAASLVAFQSSLSTGFTSQPRVGPFSTYHAELESSAG